MVFGSMRSMLSEMHGIANAWCKGIDARGARHRLVCALGVAAVITLAVRSARGGYRRGWRCSASWSSQRRQVIADERYGGALCFLGVACSLDNYRSEQACTPGAMVRLIYTAGQHGARGLAKRRPGCLQALCNPPGLCLLRPTGDR